jgi:hypothetical protein
VARLVASLLFGALWSVWGIHAAVATFAVALVGAMALASVLLAHGHVRRRVA